MKRQEGFTLVELIVVIVVLGILASFVIPRFASIDKKAREAVVQGLAGSIRGAAALAHGVNLVERATASAAANMEGTAVTMANRYPTADTTGIVAALSGTPSDFTITAAAGPPKTETFESKGATTPANCSIVYTQAAANEAPIITVDITGC